MSGWLFHYVVQDFYYPVWPNIAASAVLAVWALRKFVRLEKLHHKHHETHMRKLQEIDDAVRNSQSGKLGELRGSKH